MDPSGIVQAALWAAELYEQRTILMATNKGNISFADPSTRVSWHEIRTKFPDVSGPDARVEFQPVFNREMKRRKLWRVLQGKQSAQDWYASTKRMETPRERPGQIGIAGSPVGHNA